jgi:hypothetical protein
MSVALYAVRPPVRRTLVVLALLGYVGFCGFGAYLTGRSALRAQVWGGGALDARLGQMGLIAQSIHPITPDDATTLNLIDARLNQSALIGSSVRYITSHQQSYSLGGELLTSLAAPIPRSLWPDKPVVAGGSQIATEYTGIPFAPGTSIATGPVFEGFVNFGWAGVIAVMGLWGAILALLDAAAGWAIRQGNYYRFALAFVPGTALIDSIQNVALVTASITSSLVVVWLIEKWFHLFRSERRRETQP